MQGSLLQQWAIAHRTFVFCSCLEKSDLALLWRKKNEQTAIVKQTRKKNRKKRLMTAE